MEAYSLISLLNINMLGPWHFIPAHALHGMHGMARKWRGDKKISCQDGLDCALAARSIFRSIGDRRGEGMALHGVAVAQVRAEVNEVVLQGGSGWEAAATEAVRLFQQSGYRRMEAFETVCIAQWTIGINPRKAMKLAEGVMKPLSQAIKAETP